MRVCMGRVATGISAGSEVDVDVGNGIAVISGVRVNVVVGRGWSATVGGTGFGDVQPDMIRRQMIARYFFMIHPV